MIILFFLFFILFLIWIEFKRTRILLSFFNLFLIYWFFYTIGYYFSGEEISLYNLKATVLIVFAGLSFIIGYYFIPIVNNKFIETNRGDFFYKIPDLRIFLVILSLIAYLLFVYIVFVKIGYKEYFFTTRAHRSLIVRPYSKFMIFVDLFNIISSLSLFLYLKTRRKIYKFIFFVIFFTALLHSILTISRNSLVMLLLPIFYILHYYRYVSAKQIILFLILGILVATLWKTVLGSALLKGNFNIDQLEHIKFPREFVVWQEIANNVLSRHDLMFNGESYINSFVNFIYPHHVENLSLWYVKVFEPDVYLKGGGRGFSNVLEAYLNFGILGVFIVFFFIGLVIYFLQNKSKTNLILFFSYAFSLSFIHRVFRADFLSLTKTWWWMYFMSFAVIFLGFKFLEKVSSES